MNLTGLKYFLAVMEAGNFSDAADALYITQSAVSKQVKALEEELGLTLFDRSRRKIRPTQAAELILPHVRSILSECDALSRTVREHTRRLRISAIPIINHYDLIDLIAQFQRLHPEVELTIMEREGSAVPQLLSSEGCELAILRLLPNMDYQYDFLLLTQDLMTAVLPQTHPLAGEEIIDLAQLAQERFLLLNEETLLFRLCLSICQDSGFTPQIVYTGNRVENILRSVSHGMGVSLMTQQSAAYHNIPGIVSVPLRKPVKSSIVLAARKGRPLSPAAALFWSFFRRHISQKEGV